MTRGAASARVAFFGEDGASTTEDVESGMDTLFRIIFGVAGGIEIGFSCSLSLIVVRSQWVDLCFTLYVLLFFSFDLFPLKFHSISFYDFAGYLPPYAFHPGLFLLFSSSPSFSSFPSVCRFSLLALCTEPAQDLRLQRKALFLIRSLLVSEREGSGFPTQQPIKRALIASSLRYNASQTATQGESTGSLSCSQRFRGLSSSMKELDEDVHSFAKDIADWSAPKNM